MVNRMKNEMKMEFDAISANEAFARVRQDFQIIHERFHKHKPHTGTEGKELRVTVIDKGCGIEDVAQAMEPMSLATWSRNACFGCKEICKGDRKALRIPSADRGTYGRRRVRRGS